MSLLKNKKAEDQRKAEAEAKRREEERMRELAKNPLVKRGCDRNVRDAYIHGVIVAALADGDVSEIDDGERKVIDSIARSLNLCEAEVTEAVNVVNSCEDMLALLEECVRQLPDESAVKVFVCDFARVWLAKGVENADVEELYEYLAEQFPQWSDFKIMTAIRKVLVRVLDLIDCADADLVQLADWLGDEALKYLVLDRLGDVTGRLMAERKRRNEADKVIRFFDVVSGIVDELGITNEIRTNDAVLMRLRAKLVKKGLETVEKVKTYQSIHDAFISKVDAVQERREKRWFKETNHHDMDEYDKEEIEFCRLYYCVAWSLISLCVVKKHIQSVDISQFNGLLKDAHSRGKGMMNSWASSFWTIDLHKRAQKVLGLQRVENDENDEVRLEKRFSRLVKP